MKKLIRKIRLYKRLVLATAEATDEILICLRHYTDRGAIFCAHSVQIESLLYKIKKEDKESES